MRPTHCTITPAIVRSFAHQALFTALPWKPFGRSVTPTLLIDLLLLASSIGSSVCALAKRFGFSHQTALDAVAANLPQQPALTNGLLDALHRFGSRRWRRRRWVVAIDEHRCPFYGDRSTQGVSGGQKKHGSKYAYGYATAVLVHQRHRYTVGLIALNNREKPHQIVAALLDQIQKRGLKLRAVVLDSGFDSGETLLLLQQRRLCYALPLRRKGKGKNRRNAIWELPEGTVQEVQWQTDPTRQKVSTQVLVMRLPTEKDKKVYAFAGFDEKKTRTLIQKASLARRWYRKRFGIETSYRQMNQGKAKTTKKCVRYRLLLIGLALLLRQVWVWLTWQIARDRQRKPSAWVGELPMASLCDWLADCLKQMYRQEQEIALQSPLLPLDGCSF